MKARHSLLVVLLVSAALAQTTPPARPPANASRPALGKAGSSLPPDPDLFDGTKFEAEKRPETGMIGEFEMPGSEESQDNKVGGNPGEPAGSQAAQNSAPAGAQSAAGAAGGAGGAAQAGGSEGASGSGGESAVGGALDQSKPMGSSGQAGGGGDPNAKAEGVQAESLSGGSNSAAQSEGGKGGGKQKPPNGKIGSAELRIDALPESDKDVVGKEAAPGGTQGSNKAMPAGKGGQGSQNQNKGVEKGKVIPKGL
jgi:hypothetical protein